MLRVLCYLCVIIPLLSGCGTLSTIRNTVLGDPTIDGKDKVEYAKVIEEKEAEFREFRERNRSTMPFHYAGIVLVIGGFVLAALGKTTKDEGAIGILCGFALSAWGLLAPRFLILPFTVIGAVIIISGGIVFIEIRKSPESKPAR